VSMANRMLPDTSQHSEGARNVIARVRLHWARWELPGSPMLPGSIV
jgi:hypothetical protein